MKTLVVLSLLVSSFAYSVSPAKKADTPKQTAQAKKEMPDKLKMLDKKTEDCDEKAKKPVEIKPETISLSGNTGCSLDEAH